MTNNDESPSRRGIAIPDAIHRLAGTPPPEPRAGIALPGIAIPVDTAPPAPDGIDRAALERLYAQFAGPDEPVADVPPPEPLGRPADAPPAPRLPKYRDAIQGLDDLDADEREMAALRTCINQLAPLSPDARRRVIAWLADKHGAKLRG